MTAAPPVQPARDVPRPAATPALPWVADPQFMRVFSIAFARRHAMLGLSGAGGRLPVAMGDAMATAQLDAVARLVGRPVTPVPCERDAVLAAINAAYGSRDAEVGSIMDTIEDDGLADALESIRVTDDLLDSSGRAPVIKLVNALLFDAVKQQASDIHVHPYEDRFVVRFRVDGVMFNAFPLPKTVQEEFVSRVKVMAQMDIAEKRLPQDGRATVRVGDRVIDLRVATLPTSHGERIVMRLLDKSARVYQLNELGMAPESLEQFRGVIGVEHGLVLVTGPTGSGKSTTLYGSVLELNSVEKNILTLEDPVEYQLPGVSQTQINTKKGLTFAAGLRSVLRQDPDIIMLGEIRDRDTATMAIQSALTGHLVFSTLHTNDAASAATRLLDLGIEPYLVASSVIAILAQRLVRRVCPACALPAQLSEAEAARLRLTAGERAVLSPVRGRGCEHCRDTGYRGRIGLFELMVIQEPLRNLINQRATASQIQAAAVAGGMATLGQDGLAKIAASITTADEVLRVTARAAE